MVYCEQDMCESKLGRLMQAFRTDRPSEWQMDEFIGMAEDMHKMNKELLAVIERVIGSSEKFDKVMGTSEWADGYKQCAIDTGEALRGILDAMKARAAS